MRKNQYKHKSRRGSIAVLTAILMTFLLGMVAFAIDCGAILQTRAQLQNAADAGARAGASSLKAGTSAAQTTAQTLAQAHSAAGHSISVDPAQDIELGRWDKTKLTFTPLTGSARSSANAVRVNCQMVASRGNSLGLFFAPVLGKKNADVTAKAVAICTPTLCGPFVGLQYVTINGSYTDSYNSSDGSYGSVSKGNQGHVCSNGDITLTGGSTVHGDAHPGVGRSVAKSGYVTGSRSPLTDTLVEPAIDPGSAATVNDNNKLPASNGNKSIIDSQGNFSLGSKDDVTLLPGTTAVRL